jgi:DNA repair exonuclease SbcCD nuclease subunit
MEKSGITFSLSGFPFVRNDIGGRFSAILRETGWEECDAGIKILCLHQTVEGARVGPADFTFRRGRDVVSMQDIPGDAAAVLCGHIHREQVLWKGADGRSGSKPVPVIYPGSVERTSFAEKSERKGFYLIEIAPPAGRIPADCRLEFVELPTRPMIDLPVPGGLSPEDLEKHLSSRLARLDRNSIVRLRPAAETDRASRLPSSAFLRRIAPAGIDVQISAAFFRDPRTGRKS